MLTQKITQAQVDYVLAHINDRPRVKVARDAGVSLDTLYRIVREAGGELRHDLSTKREGIEDTVRAYYPTMTAPEICARFGYSKTRVNMWARRLGVRHSAETEQRIKTESMARLAEARAQMDYKAAHDKWRRKRRYDELRVMSGLRPLTKFRMKAMQRKAYQAKWNLCRKWGYTTADGEPYTLYYDGTTRRMDESYYTKKYGLKFEYYGAETENDDNNLLEGQRHCP